MLKLDLVALVSPSFPSPHLVWHRKAGVRSGRWSIALLCLLWILGGCAVRTLPVEEAATPLTSETFRRTLDMYLYPDRLDRRVLVGSLDALESRFDSVRFDDDEENQQGILTVGEAKVTVPVAPTFEREQYRRVLARALHFVARNLREEIKPDETLELISLRGALNALDRYSTVFSGRSTDDFKIRFSGKLFGIGSQIGRRDGDLIAIHVFPDSPAERGGLKDGDAIITVDGDPTQPLSLHEAVDRIRGEVDTQIVLGVRRGEEKEELEITITRGEVVVPSVETKKLSDRIGYSRIFQVSRNTAVEFAEKTNALGNLDGLVLDLRGNTGGSMTAASHLADLFLSRQLILRVVNRDGEPASTRSRQIAGPEVLFPFKTVVLVDGSTASAAEILSGAMAPLGHVTIVGQTTFGKGLIQQVIPLPDENLLKLTVAEYLLSGDRAIHGKGIEPDIVLYPVPDKSLGELADVPENALPYIRISGEDDTFPIDFSQRMLEIGNEAAIAETRISANKSINEQLEDFGVVWRSASSQLPSELGAALEVSATGADLVAGESSVLTLEVHNPNSFPVPDTWIALRAPATYVQNQLVSLGTLPAGGSAKGSFEITPPNGLSAKQHPVKVLIASGDRHVGSQQIVLAVANHAPLLAIEVKRLAPAEIGIRLTNRGEHPTGPVLIGVPGATRSLESMAPGAVEDLQLPLSARPEEVAVTLTGPWAMRRIEIPIPEQSVSVVPPQVELERGGLPGMPQVRLRAVSDEGLREGWIRMDGQKEAYVGWNGRHNGTLDSPLSAGDHDLTVKVETNSGVSIIDARHLTDQ